MGERVWRPANPSIVAADDGYKVICRTVNYIQKGARDFHTFDERGIYQTRNFFLEYDKDFHLLSQSEIIEDPPHETVRESNILGLEDCRLFRWKDRNYFTCTTLDTNVNGIPQISLCELESEAHQGELLVKDFLPLLGPNPYRCEKNWLPFVKDGNLHVIYSYDPFVIYAPDLVSGSCECVMKRNPSS